MPDQRQRPARHLVLVVVLVLGWLALAAGPAAAQPLTCGDTVTHDTTLTGDLLDCSGDGLVIGADGITVDLNGHTISGRIILGGSLDQVGIDNRGHDGLTIRNGILGAPAASRDNVIGGNVVNAANSANIAPRFGRITDTLVARNSLDDNFGPAIESDGDRSLIRRNTITSTLFVASTLFGIQVDGGVNRASGNGNPAQRLGVRCS